jgi:hypothetical protein
MHLRGGVATLEGEENPRRGMNSQPCTIADCPQQAWRVCERCQRPFCKLHACRSLYEDVRDMWGGTIVYEFVCFDCLPRPADKEDDPAVRET